MTDKEELNLKSMFMKGDADRSRLIADCEKYAGWTLPYMFPREGMDDQELQYDYQSTGAVVTTHLSNKIMMTLFQPSQPFFKLNLDAEQEAQVKELMGVNPAQIREALSKAEREAMGQFNKADARETLTDVIALLLITGNCLLLTDLKEGLQYWSLRDYVVKRTLRGKVKHIVMREEITLDALDDDIRALAMAKGLTEDTHKVTLYTGIRSVGGRHVITQELEDLLEIESSRGSFPEAESPYQALIWNKSRNRDYGVGLVEAYAGSFHSLSSFKEASLDLAVLMTDVKNLVNPTGMTDVETIANSPSGAYVPGREEDLFVHSPNIQSNKATLREDIMAEEAIIKAGFLMTNVRQAERVTAEEIRMLVAELAGAFGGVYARLATSVQMPLAKEAMKLVSNVFKSITPTIISGLESLSRSSDLDRMRGFVGDLVMLSDVPELVAERLNYEGLISDLGAGWQVDYTPWLLDEKTIAANREQRAQDNANVAGQEAQAVNNAGVQ